MENKQHFYGKAREWARRVLIETQHAYRKLLAPANYGFIVLFALCISTIALTALGFAFQGSESAPAQVPVPPSLSISFAPGTAPPTRLFIYTFLEQTPAPTRLIITATGIFVRHQVSTNWTLDVQGFTGYLCPGQASLHLIPFTQQGVNDYYIPGHSTISAISGAPFLAVRLCWNHGPPLITSSSYISAALSPILAPSGQSGTVTRSLVLGGSSLTSYTLAGGVPPTEATAQAWVWSSSLSNEIQNQARFEIPIIASSLPGIQHDNQNAFYSGIFFGIAGGAAVSIIPVLLDAVDRYRDRKKYTVDSGDSHPSDPSLTVGEMCESAQDNGTTAKSCLPTTSQLMEE
jgi:hypothetical protein